MFRVKYSGLSLCIQVLVFKHIRCCNMQTIIGILRTGTSLTLTYCLHPLSGNSNNHTHIHKLWDSSGFSIPAWGTLTLWGHIYSCRHTGLEDNKNKKEVMFKRLNNWWIQWTESLWRYFSHNKGWSPQIGSWILHIPQDLRLSRRPHEGGLSIVSCRHWQPHIYTRRLYSSPDNVFI